MRQNTGNNFAAGAREHYQTADSVEIPVEILVQHELPDAELAFVLGEHKGGK